VNQARVSAERRLILIGMMGSGKSTVGRLLAADTGLPYIDNDVVLAEGTGETARQISIEGEAAVRAVEGDTLRRELASRPPCIVGLAAGTILDPANRKLIKAAGTVVWLRARPETLAARAVGGTHRPCLASDPLGWFRTVTAQRDPLYAVVADFIVDVDDQSPAETAETVKHWAFD
jgi:shikimate kinase